MMKSWDFKEKLQEKFPDVADQIIDDYELYPGGNMTPFHVLMIKIVIALPEFEKFVNDNYTRKS